MKHHSFFPCLFSLIVFAGISLAFETAKAADSATLAVTCSTGQQANILTEPTAHLKIDFKNPKPEAQAGTEKFTVTDQDGNETATWTEDLNVKGTATIQHDVSLPRYGLYTLAITGPLKLSFGPMDDPATFAYVPPQKELTEAQKLASPYGTNYHIADPRLFDAFKKAGVYWFRSYAFTLDDMDRAKGADHRYSPPNGYNYRAIIDDYDKNGVYVLPILDAIHPPKDGNIGPSDEWKTKMHDVIAAFPTVKYWELSNEYDLNAGSKTEPPIHWKNYLLYHKAFGDIVAEVGHGKVTAVENGRSEILPQTVTRFIKTGDFDNIGVVNSHHYTGAEPPEVNFYNYNTGGERSDDIRPGTLFDMLKAMKVAADSDGKKRQSWISEFGWDTKFGPTQKVSLAEQAAYLQRAFLLIIASGTERGFWFYNFDLTGMGGRHGYFDGCGLLNTNLEPKPSFSAMAGMTSILPTPVYVGTINAGPNTAGYVFEEDSELVAALWAIKGTGPKVTFHTEQLMDYLGNKLDGFSAELKIAPVYAIGLDKSDILYRQTAYSLDSPQRIEATAGDLMTPVILVKNNRAQEIKATIKLSLPSGWTAEKPEVTITVPPGAQQKISMPYTINPDEKLGVQEITFTATEGTEAVKTFSETVAVVHHFEYHVGSITGAPGKTTVPVTIRNRTAFPQSGNLVIKVPQSWQAPATIPVKDIQPTEDRSIPVELTWSPDWKDGESASITFQPTKLAPETLPIIPNQFHLNQATGITPDGDLSDWAKSDAFPSWMLGCTSGAPDAKLWMAWAPEGLYVAVEVHDSVRKVDDPRTFWDADSLELFLSTRGDSAPDKLTPADHHFWMVPQVQDKKVYIGEWIMENNRDMSRYDLPGIKSAAVQTDDGYIMEFLLPASLIKDFPTASGGSFRLDAILNVHGSKGNREIYWPENKASGVVDHPNDWGLIKLN